MPYANAPRPADSKAASGSQTTGDVAEWLENKYHIMEIFATVHSNDIAKELENSVAGALESLMMGAPPRDDAFASAASKIKTGFQTFLLSGEMEHLGYPGVPTGAALKGIDHRLKHPYAKSNSRRVSFSDTGLYETSSRVWVETE